MNCNPGGVTNGAPRTRLAPVSVADAAEEHLRALLFSGAFAPGQELRDTVIASELNIARPTARTVVQRLVSEGLLEREPGHSARVCTVTAEDVMDLCDVRRLIESEAVRRITTQRRGTAVVAKALGQFREVGETWEAGPDADVAFHSAVVAASGSPRLIKMFASIGSEMRLMIALLRGRYSSLSELVAEHTALLESLESGDTQKALARWYDHIHDAEGFLIRALDIDTDNEMIPGAVLNSAPTRRGLV